MNDLVDRSPATLRLCRKARALVVILALTATAQAGAAGVDIATVTSSPIAPAPYTAEEVRGGYRIHAVSADNLTLAEPQLPDLSRFTPDAVAALIRSGKRGRVELRRMSKQPALEDFTAGERLTTWAARQKSTPQAIYVVDGYVTPRDIALALKGSDFAETSPGVFIARLPIVVDHGASLHVDGKTRELRLSQERGSFLVNDGELFITDTKLTGWSEKADAPASFQSTSTFRPFVVSWGGAAVYISRSTVASLGYEQSKSYGLSVTQYSPDVNESLKRPSPKAWLIDSTFVDLYYGFYCYEADDLVIARNTYRDNIVYGIDPHDRSHRLIIAENDVYGSKKKHGIIVSREVNDSWIFRNRSHHNHLSGIVLDRSSVGNVVAYNEIYANDSDGITIYESPDNLLWHNVARANKRHGIRIRNSADMRLYHNDSVGNGTFGVYGHIKDLDGTDRNLTLDPYRQEVSLLLVGGRLAANGTGQLSLDRPLSALVYGVQFAFPTKAAGVHFSGVLEAHQHEILDILVRGQKAVAIEVVPKQAAQLTVAP